MPVRLRSIRFHLGYSLCLVLSFFMTTTAAAVDDRGIVVIAGGESHAMIDACDCEHSPGGGVVKRATLVRNLRKTDSVVLVDAGGFSAGGIYDDYTSGHAADSVRTVQMLAAMGAMKYDAATIGDDELQWGGRWLVGQAAANRVPLVSANCYSADGTLLCPPFIIVKHAGIRIGITGVCTAERLFPLDTTVRVTDAAAAIGELWPDLVAASDLQIILAHTGPEISNALASQFPDADIIVNGHRKSDSEPGVITGGRVLMEFGFQGKNLSSVRCRREKKGFSFSTLHWVQVTPDIADDGTMAALVAKTGGTVAVHNRYDLYMMSQCPYGLQALREFCRFVSQQPSVQWDIWFIGTVAEDSALVSLHGSGEVADEMIWLAIRHFYPDKWNAFCEKRSSSEGDTRELASALGIDMKKIDAWVRSSGNGELRQQYRRSMRQSIDASPTLLVNNRPFGRKITYPNLLRFECKSVSQADSAGCVGLPECAEDGDCRKKGYHGSCTPSGSCQFTRAVPFTFTILTAGSTIQHPEDDAKTTTGELFPGATIRSFTMDSPEGKKLLERFKPLTLPFYLFDSAVVRDSNFPRISDGVIKTGAYYTFRPGVVPANYLLSRTKKSGKLTLYCDPFFRGTGDILRKILGDKLTKEWFAIEPLFYADPESVQPGTEEYLRQEEALRWLTISKIAPSRYPQYLMRYGYNPGSSWWTVPLSGTDISPDTLRAAARDNADGLRRQWALLQVMAQRGPIIILRNNAEMITVNGEQDFWRMVGACMHGE